MASKEVLGILGGLGPLASAQFVLSIYENYHYGREQDMLALHLSSHPDFPDRTTALLNGQKQELLTRTQQSLDTLLHSGATRIVICCFTLHALLSEITHATRKHVLSLPDLALQELQYLQQPALLLCTTGTRKLQIFEKTSAWSSIARSVIWPQQDDQDKIHRLIYAIKANMPASVAYNDLSAICNKYTVPCWICGCTEFHLISRYLCETTRDQSYPILVDPLMYIAKNIRHLASLKELA
jgi:aspartate racemase